tara:strand:- start:5774 stop:6742 length:969 start_codon:yes stop_codon:yes gene_type:complete
MKAITIHQTGGPDVMQLEDIPTPKLKNGEILVEIKSIGVNYTDVASRRGTNIPDQFPWIPGREAAGIVVEVGKNVSDIQVGDRVAYAMATGSYAEYAAVPAWLTVPIPDDMSFETASAILLQAMTAHFLANDITNLQKGDTALVHAGAGGVGLLLIQMLKMLEVYVYTTISTEAKAKLAKEAGADCLIQYTTDDFEKIILDQTNEKGIEIVYDAVGDTTFQKGLNILKPRGYMVLYGTASAPVPPFDTNLLRGKSIFLTRPMLGDYTASREELLNRASTVLTWVQEESLKIRIGLKLSLAEAAEAHRQLEGRQTTGKVILTV